MLPEENQLNDALAVDREVPGILFCSENNMPSTDDDEPDAPPSEDESDVKDALRLS